MPKTWSNNLKEIHKSSRRRDTLVIYTSDGNAIYLSRGVVNRALISYNNAISAVDPLRQTLDAGVDRITVTCQNVDSLLGFNIASNLRLLDYALCEYGRVYQSVRNPALIEDIPVMFPGVLANAEADETRIRFELIADYESLGSVIAARSLSPRCQWKYKNGIECTSTSSALSCPKTRPACIKREAEKDFGGFEYFEEPESNVPGAGGNNGGGIGGGMCFTGSTRVWTPAGEWTFAELKTRFDLGLRSIYSYNPHNGQIEVDEIEEIFVHPGVTGYFTLEFDHDSVEVTPEHPFLFDWGLFKPADGFARKDTTKIVDNNGKWRDSELRRIKWNSDKSETVYNCRVKKNRTYFANLCAVHNSKNGPLDF